MGRGREANTLINRGDGQRTRGLDRGGEWHTAIIGYVEMVKRINFLSDVQLTQSSDRRRNALLNARG